MNSDPSFRRDLIARLPDSADLPKFRAEVHASIEKNHRRIRRERAIVTAFWVFCAASATIYIWFGPEAGKFPRAPFLACIFFIWGGVEIVKHHINSARIDTLKELKQIELQILELSANNRSASH